ncbi:cytosolic enolase [Actinidia rufa]|uniref:phosphopyruvate hydratase n=1 Tax=Actinidia rufa TaxID=165716 RepID=A0A7J0FSL6_9ERIC|nr:cytosolic enolase [Actinidia rufa]
MSVQEYLDKHMLSRKIEDAVNAAVRAKTSDPVLFISNHMRKAVPSVITKVKARQILDSRGIPTVEVDLYTNKGMFRASAPSGVSSGMYEATELRDGDKGMYLGNSVQRAVKNINEKISEALIGMDPTLQSQIDQAMIDLDKTEKKGELGANAILAVSIAACKAGAAEKEACIFVPLYKHISDLSGRTNMILPVPAFCLISGGKHAGNTLAIQDIMILPVGARKFEEAMQMGSETYHHLKCEASKLLLVTRSGGGAGAGKRRYIEAPSLGAPRGARFPLLSLYKLWVLAARKSASTDGFETGIGFSGRLSKSESLNLGQMKIEPKKLAQARAQQAKPTMVVRIWIERYNVVFLEKAQVRRVTHHLCWERVSNQIGVRFRRASEEEAPIRGSWGDPPPPCAIPATKKLLFYLNEGPFSVLHFLCNFRIYGIVFLLAFVIFGYYEEHILCG